MNRYHWDAGDLGCGELVIGLKRRIATLPPGAELEVTATDPGIPEDLPAWCRLTNHVLVRADPPVFVIRTTERN